MNPSQRLAHYTDKIAKEVNKPTYQGPRQQERMTVLRHKRKRMKRIIRNAPSQT